LESRELSDALNSPERGSKITIQKLEGCSKGQVMPIQFFVWLFIGLCLIILLVKVGFYRSIWIVFTIIFAGFLEEGFRQQCFYLFIPSGVFLLLAVFPFIQDIRLSWKYDKEKRARQPEAGIQTKTYSKNKTD